MKIQQNQKKSVTLEKEISVEDMQKIVDANDKIIKELEDGKNTMLVNRKG